MSFKNEKAATFIKGFLIGGLAGVTLALLNAPRSGKKTRAQISSKGVKLRNMADQAMDEVLDTLKSTTAELSERTEELNAQSQATMEVTRRQLSQASKEIKQVTADAIKELQEIAKKTGKEIRETAKETQA